MKSEVLDHQQSHVIYIYSLYVIVESAGVVADVVSVCVGVSRCELCR